MIPLEAIDKVAIYQWQHTEDRSLCRWGSGCGLTPPSTLIVNPDNSAFAFSIQSIAFDAPVDGAAFAERIMAQVGGFYILI